MPARHHRGIDRIAAILEIVAHEPGGLTLTELAGRIDAPKSSLQGLVYGLVATGYLDEHGKRYYLGPAPFVLSLMNNPVTARGLRHDALVELQARVAANIILAVQVGDSYVSIDRVISDDHRLEYVHSAYRRGPLLRSAMGKTILANLPIDEMHGYLASAGRDDPEGVREFLSEVRDIKSTRLAFNHGTALAGVHAVAAPVFDRDGNFIAAVGATGTSAIDSELEDIGRRLLDELDRMTSEGVL